MHKNLLLIAGGPITDRCREKIRSLYLPDSTIAVACDSGIETFFQLGIVPHYLIGDLDSTSAETLKWAKENSKTTIEQFQADKDETDLELALRFCNVDAAQSVSIFGVLNGRQDFTLSNLHLIAHYAAQYPGIMFTVENEQGTFHFPSPLKENVLDSSEGSTFSLIPLSKTVEKICLSQAKWPLTDATLAFGSGWGLSNQALAESITLSFASGMLAVFVFDAL